MARFREKSPVVEAFQYNGELEVPGFEVVMKDSFVIGTDGQRRIVKVPCLVVPIPVCSVFYARPGKWIITESNGNRFVMADSDFRQIYEFLE